MGFKYLLVWFDFNPELKSLVICIIIFSKKWRFGQIMLKYPTCSKTNLVTTHRLSGIFTTDLQKGVYWDTLILIVSTCVCSLGQNTLDKT